MKNINDEELSNEDNKKIHDALEKTRKSPPPFTSEMIRHKALEKINEDRGGAMHNVVKINRTWTSSWAIAASAILSFFIGYNVNDSPNKLVDDVSISKSPLVFQGEGDNTSLEYLNDAPRDEWLREIAQSALIGDIQRTEIILQRYKIKFPDEEQ